MQVVYRRCAGLAVHKKPVVACVLTTGPDGQLQEQVRTFGTMTGDLVALSRWLQEQQVEQVEQVAVESTGVYWWPVFNLLEADGHAVLLVNPQPVKAITTDSPQWKQGRRDRGGRGDRSGPCPVRPAPSAP